MNKEMKQLLEEMKIDFGISNVKSICYSTGGEVWKVEYIKGKDNIFHSFDAMYEFLKTEGNGE